MSKFRTICILLVYVIKEAHVHHLSILTAMAQGSSTIDRETSVFKSEGSFENCFI